MTYHDNLPPLRPPPRPHSPTGHRTQSSLSQTSTRSGSSLSTTSNNSDDRPLAPMQQRTLHVQQSQGRPPVPTGVAAASQSTTNLPRQPYRTSMDGPSRTASPQMPGQPFTHRARQHSQGFFEPSLPHAASNPNGLSASQIAAQTAMHHISPPAQSQERKRSFGLAPINTARPLVFRKSSDSSSPQVQSAGGLTYSNGMLGGHRLAAATAANVAFPNGRSPLPSPLQQGPPMQTSQQTTIPPPEKETKGKSSKMKLFSKPKAMALSKEKEGKVAPGASSPVKTAISAGLLRSGFANASTTSLIDPTSSASSIYSSANVSTSTLMPATVEKEREKRHHFLSRQKHKIKDESSALPLSSAHSNSEPTNPEKPQPLYSFTPDSPGPNSFAKSMSGFDLRHAGKALREKRKEDKAAAASAKLDLKPTTSNTPAAQGDHYTASTPYEVNLGPPTNPSASVFNFGSDSTPGLTAQAFSSIGEKMGLPGIGPDDAWPLLKARLLNLFSGEDLRTPIEDFNTLVNVHVRRCIQRKSPIVLVEDVRELLQTGFGSLAQTLRGVPDDRLVPKLVEMWINVYSSIVPFLQAVLLPLDMEFKGRGSIMSAREAQEFWGAMPESLKSDERPSSAGGVMLMPTLGEELDVRRITLMSFRDTVILPKHESLMAIFSRLSLDSINAATSPNLRGESDGRKHARSDPATTGAERPGTAGSLSPHFSSFNSQGSTLLDAASSSSGGALSLASRSRATSNTSAGSFGTGMPHLSSPLAGPGSFSATSHTPPSPAALTDPAQVTETVARMLQCLYVLASCQTGDAGQGVVERLTGALKYNWLGRGRTGRDRRGWVGMKSQRRVGLVGA